MPNNTNEYEVLTQFTDTQGNVHEVGSKVILTEDEAVGGLERGELALLTPVTPPIGIFSLKRNPITIPNFYTIRKSNSSPTTTTNSSSN